MALTGTIVWSAVERKRPGYEKVYFWLTVYIRYYLAFTMMGYGFIKVFKTQFPFPSLGKLVQPVGELSPMMGSDSLKLVVRKQGFDDFLLINRGFHWINESPFNR
jgi:hypothetical protein